MKIVTLFLLLLPSLMEPVASPSTASTVSETDNLRIRLDARFELGRQSRNCRGFGICSVTVDGSIEEPITNTSVDATVTFDDGVATSVEFHTEALDPETYKEYFADAIFTIGETFKQTLKEKKLRILLKKGKYKLRKTKTGFLLEVSG